MKLVDIIQEDDKDLNAILDKNKPVELRDVLKYFPNTYKKAVKTLAKKGRLTFNGSMIFDLGGEHYGPALEEAIALADKLITDDDTTIEIQVEMDGSVADIDDGGEFTIDYPLDDMNEVYTGYSPRENKLLVGYDAWLNEEIFNEQWDEEFEKVFGEDFEMDNPDHEKIFNKSWKQFKEAAFQGVLITVDGNGHAEIDLVLPGGFFAGIHKNPIFRRLQAIDFADHL